MSADDSVIGWEAPEVEAEFRRLYRDGWARGARSARNGVAQCSATVDLATGPTYRCHKAHLHPGPHEDSGGQWNDEEQS